MVIKKFCFPFLFISLMGWHSCTVTHSNAKAVTKWDETTVTPKIVFLNYSVKKKKSDGVPEILLISKKIVEGKLKINNNEPEILKPGDLKCIMLDNHLNPFDSILVPDPLNVTVESVDENNAFFKKEIVKDSARFSIRLQFTEKIYAVGIKKSTNFGSQNPYLLITKLK